MVRKLTISRSSESGSGKGEDLREESPKKEVSVPTLIDMSVNRLKIEIGSRDKTLVLGILVR